MNVQITHEKFEFTPEIKEMIDKKFTAKLDQLLIDYNEEMKTATMHIERDKYGKYEANFDMKLPGKKGGIIFAKNNHKLLITTIVGLREEVEKQIKKYKEEQVY